MDVFAWRRISPVVRINAQMARSQRCFNQDKRALSLVSFCFCIMVFSGMPNKPNEIHTNNNNFDCFNIWWTLFNVHVRAKETTHHNENASSFFFIFSCLQCVSSMLFTPRLSQFGHTVATAITMQSTVCLTKTIYKDFLFIIIVFPCRLKQKDGKKYQHFRNRRKQSNKKMLS